MILRNDSSNNDNLRGEEQNKETSLSINIYKGKEFVMMRPLTMSPVLVSQFLILVRIIDRCWPVLRVITLQISGALCHVAELSSQAPERDPVEQCQLPEV